MRACKSYSPFDSVISMQSVTIYLFCLNVMKHSSLSEVLRNVTAGHDSVVQCIYLYLSKNKCLDHTEHMD